MHQPNRCNDSLLNRSHFNSWRFSTLVLRFRQLETKSSAFPSCLPPLWLKHGGNQKKKTTDNCCRLIFLLLSDLCFILSQRRRLVAALCLSNAIQTKHQNKRLLLISVSYCFLTLAAHGNISLIPIFSADTLLIGRKLLTLLPNR